ncbi:MAG: class IV adenylate cyclase [Thermoanaerobaculum sp.]
MSREEELKFTVPSLVTLRARLLEFGWQPSKGPILEENWVLDDRKGNLRQRGCLLRVRRWGEQKTLTFKGPARFRRGVKEREELEVAVSDEQVVLSILASLGFAVAFRYQKLREELVAGVVKASLDSTPMGDFLELEGPGEEIRRTAAALGLVPEQALTGSYLELWQKFRAGHPELPEDMVFAR